MKRRDAKRLTIAQLRVLVALFMGERTEDELRKHWPRVGNVLKQLVRMGLAESVVFEYWFITKKGRDYLNGTFKEG